MKKILFILSIFPVLALAQSQDQNYIKSTTYKGAGATIPVVQISYFDGLGRPIQQIANGQSATGKDIVTHMEYDGFGRQPKEFLPYANATASLNYNPNAGTETGTFYNSPAYENTTNPFSEKRFEASPLNRVLEQGAPGDAWSITNSNKHTIRLDYQANVVTDAVKLFIVTTSWNDPNKSYNISLSSSTNYPVGELYKTITKDENWTTAAGKRSTTEEFKDKEGRVLLKRTYTNYNSRAIIAHDTYYVYDQYGNLTYVLPPLANAAIDQPTLDGLCYQYKYDYRNRLAAKKLPGKQWEYIVYDKLDRPVATGPAFSPFGDSTIGMMITDYDVFGRVTQTGWKAMTVTESDRGNWQNNINGGGNPFTLTANDILTKNYYDNYSFTGGPSPVPTTNVRGLATGSWVRVLTTPTDLNGETSYTLYDNKYRPVRSYTKNYLGGYTQVDSQLDFIGKTIATETRHKRVIDDPEILIKDSFTYSAQDRLLVHKQQINSLPEQLIASNAYDELGQLISKKVGGADASGTLGLQKVNYTYNIRGWLKGINDTANLINGADPKDLFSFKLSYNDTNNTAPLYNGNISETSWKTANDDVLREYFYGYDSMNRLREAWYQKGDGPLLNSYGENINYDKNGNITDLVRNGGIEDDNYGNPIDQLFYDYDPQNKNQLIRVFDQSSSQQGFKDNTDGITNTTAPDYTYDANGNMTRDANKGIANGSKPGIIYNHLNLPTKIIFGTNGTIEYLYDAVGQKLQKKVTEGTTVTKTEYLTGFQYENDALQFFPHAEGYVKKDETAYKYVFNYTDHLGNVRLSYSDSDGNGVLGTENFVICYPGTKPGNPEICAEWFTNSILEESNYYPFGLKHEGYNDSDQGTYKYKYNGKEFQDELGLNLYDYGARNYDPAIGRWYSIDNLSEEFYDWSPYNYVLSNPVKFVDPDGNGPTDIRILGANNSSVTIKTDLIDVSVNASSLGVDFGGNYSVGGKEVLGAALDIVGIFDPTGVADGINASISASDGNWGDALISAVGVIPYAGDLAKLGKIEKDVKIIGNAIDAVKDVDKASDLAKAESRAAKLSKTSREGKDFTKAGKEATKDVNKAKNNGKTVCETCGTSTSAAKQSKKGVTPPKNETHVDHKTPKSKGGSGTPDNGQVLCRDCNTKKSNN